MALSLNAALDAMYVRDPILRNVENLPEAVQIVLGLADTGGVQVKPAPVGVQRVDERQRNGSIVTTWEVFDRRLPKNDRIVKSGLPDRATALTEAGKRYVAGGAYVLSAVDADEYFHDTDYELLGNSNRYGVITGCTITESASDLTADLVQGEFLHGGARVAVTATTDAYTLVADGSNERWAAGCLSSAGAAVLVSGDAAASASVEPSKPEIGDRTLLKMWKIQAGQTIADNCEYKLDKRVIVNDPSLGVQNFVENSGLKGFFALGAPAAIAYTDGVWAGMGFTVELSATSGACTGAGTAQVGAWQFNTGATSGNFGMVAGPLLDDAQDWTMVWRGSVPSAASQTWFFGAKTNPSVADENGIIAFRISDTGNIIGVCDSGGTETTRDTGATGATECTLRIEVRGGGTIVRFFKDNVQVGADVTTNIPTGNLYAVNGIRNSTTADKVAYTYDLFGWREAA